MELTTFATIASQRRLPANTEIQDRLDYIWLWRENSVRRKAM